MKIAVCVAGILAIAVSGHAFAQSQNDPEAYLPVGLTCPSSKASGVLEMLGMNRLGKSSRDRVTYDNFVATSVEMSYADKGEQLRVWRTFSAADTVPIFLQFFVAGSNRATQLKLEVCESTAADKQKYFQMLEANKKTLQ